MLIFAQASRYRWNLDRQESHWNLADAKLDYPSIA
jgi:hypothetical protein